MIGTSRLRSTSATGKTTAPPTFTSRIAASRAAWDAMRSASSILAAGPTTSLPKSSTMSSTSIAITASSSTTRARQAQDEEAAEDGDKEAKEAGEDGPEEAAGSLGREVKAKTKSEEAVGRADDAEVGGAGREHARVVAKEPEPRLRPGCSGKADRFGHAECERAAGERDAQRALLLPGPDVRPDQGHEGRAEAKHQRDEQVL